jgi:CBS domain-containing protein
MLVKDAMTSPAISISSDAPLSEAVNLLVVHKLSGLPVLDKDGKLCGVLSEGDLLRRNELGTGHKPGHWWSLFASSDSKAEAYRMTNGRRVCDVMSHEPFTISETANLAEAAQMMEKHGIKRIPVVRDETLVGILSRADFVNLLREFIAPAYEESAISDEEIREKIRAEVEAQPWSVNCSLRIDVENGRVKLSGTVPGESHGEAIRVAAENVPGVQDVQQNLEVLLPIPQVGLGL